MHLYDKHALDLQCYHEVASSVNSARSKAQKKSFRNDDSAKRQALIKS